MRRSAMAASAGSRPASWRAWRRWRSRPTAMASATTRPVPPGHQGRLAARISRELAGARQSLGVRARRRSPTTSASAARSRPCPEPDGRRSSTSGIRPRPSRRSPTTRRSSAGAARHVNTLRLWSARAGRPAPPRRLQPRRPCRRHQRTRTGRGDLAGSLSQRRDAGRAGAAAAAGVFLRLRLAAGSRPAALQAVSATIRTLARQGRHPAQRHPSGDRRRRADAHPGRCARAAVGRGLGDHRRRPSATPTTRCCPRRWRPGRCR